ncbi:hypothetical protein SFR_1445 [Streptomyces sp. FR-008]|nr:hypothetical protein SFR_1445 [Streptomyces sp. FR-008]
MRVLWRVWGVDRNIGVGVGTGRGGVAGVRARGVACGFT